MNRHFRLTGKSGDLLALLAGALLPLAFAPLSWWPLVLVSIVAMAHLVFQVSTGRALWRAWLFGLGWFGIGVSWVFVSIQLFGGAGTLFAIAVTILFVAFMALYPLLSVWLATRWPGLSLRWRLLCLFPVAWTAVEWLREWLLTGFPWLQPGYAFVGTPLQSLAPLSGVLAMTWLAVFTAAAIALLLQPTEKAGFKVILGTLVAALWTGLYFMPAPSFTQPAGQTLKVALVQGNIPQHRKWLPSERQPTLQMYRALTEQHAQVDVIVWPETAVPAYEDTVTGYLDTIHAAAQMTATQVLLGIPVRETHGDRYYNALIALGGADRGPQTTYYKRHLVPFGEYLPVKWLLGPLLAFLHVPMSDFASGNGEVAPLVQAGQYRAGISICFEDIFGGEVRDALPGAHYLVNVSNDAWFGDSLAPPQHLEMARMRALETGRYLLRATNTGISAIIDPQGRLQQVAPAFQRIVLQGGIQPMQGATPYVRWGSLPILLLLGLLFALSYWRGRRPS